MGGPPCQSKVVRYPRLEARRALLYIPGRRKELRLRQCHSFLIQSTRTKEFIAALAGRTHRLTAVSYENLSKQFQRVRFRLP